MDGADLMFVGAFVYLCLCYTMKLFSKKVKIFATIIRFLESLDGKSKKSCEWDNGYKNLTTDPRYSHLPFNIHNPNK